MPHSTPLNKYPSITNVQLKIVTSITMIEEKPQNKKFHQ